RPPPPPPPRARPPPPQRPRPQARPPRQRQQRPRGRQPPPPPPRRRGHHQARHRPQRVRDHRRIGVVGAPRGHDHRRRHHHHHPGRPRRRAIQPAQQQAHRAHPDQRDPIPGDEKPGHRANRQVRQPGRHQKPHPPALPQQPLPRQRRVTHKHIAPLHDVTGMQRRVRQRAKRHHPQPQHHS